MYPIYYKACGLNDILTIKKYTPEMAPVLSKLYHKCLATSYIQACWKSSSVVPVFKNAGEPSDLSNYRPICLLPLFGKVLEVLINSELVKYLTSQRILSDKQYCFASLGQLLMH